MIRAATPRGTIARIGVTTADGDTYDDARDIDWIAVERAANGDYDGALLNRDEKHEAALLMSQSGIPSREISTRLCIYQRQIERWKVAAGLISPVRRCDIPGCIKAHATNGLCSAHHSKARRAAARAGLTEEAAA